MNTYLADLWTSVGPVFASLGLAGVTLTTLAATCFGLFKWFGERWLAQKFATQLEVYKSEQSRELERLRHRINGVFDRTIRLHTREFEVLPDLWGKLVDAYAFSSNFLAVFQSYANVGAMNDIELSEFLDRTSFSEAFKDDIKSSELPRQRSMKYSRYARMHQHNDAMAKVQDFSVQLDRNGIFLQNDLKNDMKEMLRIIRNAMSEERINIEEEPVPRLREDQQIFRKESRPLIDKIEKAVSDRLWISTTTEV